MMNFKPSTQQQAIFDALSDPNGGHIVVRARAGTGKTTTLTRGLAFVVATIKILLCAFNKRIQMELVPRVKHPKADVKTLHALGFVFIRKNWKVKVDDDREKTIVKRLVDINTPFQIICQIAKLAQKTKVIIPFAGNRDFDDIVDLAYAHNCVPNDGWEDQWPVERVAKVALRVLDESRLEDGSISFCDMVWLPLVMGWVQSWYGLVCVDEAQDMNPAMLELAKRALKKTGRLIVFGDDKQAIYGFMGADMQSLDRLKAEFNARELPLTVTRRCPKAVVNMIRDLGLCDDFESHEDAPEGTIRHLNRDAIVTDAKAGSFILSRTNAPLVGLCLSLLRADKRAYVVGRDIGKGLLALVDKLAKRNSDLGGLLESLAVWEEREIEKAKKAKKAMETRIEYVTDTADTIRALSDGLATIAELRSRIETLFSDIQSGSAVACSTVHKAKGLEADTVYVLTDTLYPGRRENDEERNIHYVALSRSKNELVLVRGKEVA